MASYNQNSPPGMLSIAEAMEQDRWIPEYNGTEMIEFIQEPQVSIEENSPQFMNWSDLSEEEKASGRYKMPEEELERLSEIVAAGKAFWRAAVQGAVDLFSGDNGMLSSSIKQLASEISNDAGRRNPVEIKNLRGEKPGWKIAEGSNFWSVDETDPYWKTQEGYEEALDLYGTKPSSLKEQDIGTLVYNPSTGEYEEVEQEEFVDLSRKVDPKLKKYF